MGEIDYSKRRVEDSPERWRNLDFASATDSQIEEIVADIYKAKANINLNVPVVPLAVSGFFKMFHCRRCGECCQGGGGGPKDGIILFTEEVERLSQVMLVSKKKFKESFTFVNDGRRLLHYPCMFFDSKAFSCTIYQIRPLVCRLYPINDSIMPRNLHPSVDGTYMMEVNSLCPEARRVACEILKVQRTAMVFYRNLDENTLRLIEKESDTLWRQARHIQHGAANV